LAFAALALAVFGAIECPPESHLRTVPKETGRADGCTMGLAVSGCEQEIHLVLIVRLGTFSIHTERGDAVFNR